MQTKRERKEVLIISPQSGTDQCVPLSMLTDIVLRPKAGIGVPSMVSNSRDSVPYESVHSCTTSSCLKVGRCLAYAGGRTTTRITYWRYPVACSAVKPAGTEVIVPQQPCSQGHPKSTLNLVCRTGDVL